ncbi:MAG: hypothetical protein HQM09_22070 [Candidatus Riflebacteria bacterium]|nr:hypothetical protein [Candidatus Riflebacteria bacterium]
MRAVFERFPVQGMLPNPTVVIVVIICFLFSTLDMVVAQSFTTPSGNEAVSFTRSNSGLIDNFIERMSLFRGSLVIGTDNGLSMIVGNRFENWRRGEGGFPDAPVRGIAMFGDRLWAGTYGKGLARLEDGQWKKFTSADSGLADDFVTALVVAGNHLFVGTREGLSVYDGMLWRNIRLDPDRVLNVTALATDRQAVLVGTTLGAFRLDENLQPVVLDLGLGFPPWIHALDATSDTIFAAYDGGVLALTADGRRLNWSENLLPSGKVFDMIAFEGGALIATGRGAVKLGLDGGVSVLDLSEFKALYGITATSLLRDGNNWWIGYSGGGLLRLNNFAGFIAYSAGATIGKSFLGMARAPQASQFRIQENQDVSKSQVSQQAPVAQTSTAPRIPSVDISALESAGSFSLPGRIRSVLEDGDFIWMATLDGLYRLKSGELPGQSLRRFGPAMPCQAVAKASGGFIWSVFETGECFRIDGENMMSMNLSGLPPAPLSLAVVDDRLLIGSDMGLFTGMISSGKVGQVPALKNRRVSVAAVEGVNVWLGCDDGLYRYQSLRDVPERVDDFSDSFTYVRVFGGDVWTGTSKGSVMRFVQGRLVDRWDNVVTGRVAAIAMGENAEMVVIGESGVSAIRAGVPDVRHLDVVKGGQALFRFSSRHWIVRGSRCELLGNITPGAGNAVAGTFPVGTGVIPAVNSSSPPVSNAASPVGVAVSGTNLAIVPNESSSSRSASSNVGGFNISNVRVFTPPESSGVVVSPQVNSPIPVPPVADPGRSTDNKNITQDVVGNDFRPEWTKFQPPSKPKNLSFYKNILPMMIKSCMPCHTTGTGKYFPLNDPATMMSYFRKGGIDRFNQFLESGNGMFGSVAPEDVQLIQTWVGEGSKE